jgi:hypothetical protein
MVSYNQVGTGVDEGATESHLVRVWFGGSFGAPMKRHDHEVGSDSRLLDGKRDPGFRRNVDVCRG